MEHILNSVNIVIPILFVLCLGFFAGKKNFFKQENAVSTINEFVLNFALPPSLFVGTISISRSELISELNLFIIFIITLLVSYTLGFFLIRKFFKRNVIESAIGALGISFAAGPFYGPALLESIYGNKSGVAISLISLALNIFIVPVTSIIIRINTEKNNNSNISITELLKNSLYNAILKTPFVWAPLLGFILVFVGVPFPKVVINSLELIGKATAGTAVFVAGLTIAKNHLKFNVEVLSIVVLKNIGLPLLFCGIALFFIPAGSDVFNQGILLAALPTGPIMAMLANKYNEYKEEASSVVAISTFGMIITITILIMLLGIN